VHKAAVPLFPVSRVFLPGTRKINLVIFNFLNFCYSITEFKNKCRYLPKSPKPIVKNVMKQK